jgi:hypothetical protein
MIFGIGLSKTGTTSLYAALTAIAGHNDRHTSVIELRRDGIDAKLSIQGFMKKMRGWDVVLPGSTSSTWSL